MIGLQTLREDFSGVCIPSAAEAGDQNQLSTYGLKPVPLRSAWFLDSLSVRRVIRLIVWLLLLLLDHLLPLLHALLHHLLGGARRAAGKAGAHRRLRLDGLLVDIVV